MKSLLTESQLYSLLDAISLINSTLDLNRILEIVMQEITNSLKADRSTLYIVDHEKNEIWSKIAQADKKLEIRQHIGSGISGYVAQSGESLNIPDAYKDSRFNPSFDHKSGYLTRTILCVPVRSREGQIIGVLQALNKKNGIFTQQDEFFVSLFADHIALAIQNARLHADALERQKLENEMSVAARIQQMLLPQKVPHIPGYEIFVYQKPSHLIGGDYYDFWLKENRLDFIVADVSGKGIPAALLMSNLQATAGFLMENESELPGLVRKLNERLFKITSAEKFVTTVTASLDFYCHKFNYIRSGHIPPVHFSVKPHTISCRLLKEGGIPLGCMPEFNFLSGCVMIEPQDVIILCSDGIIEAQDRRGEIFGLQKLETYGASACHQGADDIGIGLLNLVKHFSRDGLYEDDITLMVIKRVN